MIFLLLFNFNEDLIKKKYKSHLQNRYVQHKPNRQIPNYGPKNIFVMNNKYEMIVFDEASVLY